MQTEAAPQPTPAAPVTTATQAPEAPAAAIATPAAPAAASQTTPAPKTETAPTTLLGTAAQEIKVTVPDGANVDKELLDGFVSVAKDLGLKGEQAQKFADQYVAAAQRQEAAWKDLTEKTWVEQIKTDKEFGGTHFEETKANVSRFMSTYGDADAAKWLNESGFGNHPMLAKIFARAGAGMKEDSISGTVTPPPNNMEGMSAVDRLAATLYKKKD